MRHSTSTRNRKSHHDVLSGNVCPTCKRSTRPQPYYGYCAFCYELAVKTRGELAIIVDSYKGRCERYVYSAPDAVYVHFHRTAKEDNIWRVKVEEREWCFELIYDTFPCPPLMKFVSPFNYEDDNPLYTPRTAFFNDPLRQVYDIPYIAPRSAAHAQVNQGEFKNWLPHRVANYITSQVLPDSWSQTA